MFRLHLQFVGFVFLSVSFLAVEGMVVFDLQEISSLAVVVEVLDFTLCGIFLIFLMDGFFFFFPVFGVVFSFLCMSVSSCPSGLLVSVFTLLTIIYRDNVLGYTKLRV